MPDLKDLQNVLNTRPEPGPESSDLFRQINRLPVLLEDEAYNQQRLLAMVKLLDADRLEELNKENEAEKMKAVDTERVEGMIHDLRRWLNRMSALQLRTARIITEMEKLI